MQHRARLTSLLAMAAALIATSACADTLRERFSERVGAWKVLGSASPDGRFLACLMERSLGARRGNFLYAAQTDFLGVGDRFVMISFFAAPTAVREGSRPGVSVEVDGALVATAPGLVRNSKLEATTPVTGPVFEEVRSALRAGGEIRLKLISKEEEVVWTRLDGAGRALAIFDCCMTSMIDLNTAIRLRLPGGPASGPADARPTGRAAPTVVPSVVGGAPISPDRLAEAISAGRDNEARFNRDFRDRRFLGQGTFRAATESRAWRGEYQIRVGFPAGEVVCSTAAPDAVRRAADLMPGDAVAIAGVVGNVPEETRGDLLALRGSTCTLPPLASEAPR